MRPPLRPPKRQGQERNHEVQCRRQNPPVRCIEVFGVIKGQIFQHWHGTCALILSTEHLSAAAWRREAPRYWPQGRRASGAI